MQSLLIKLIEAMGDGQDLVACTVISTMGSTPQKAGAWMLVLADGRQFGTLGGGCIEAEVKQRASEALNRKAPSLYEFKLNDNYGWDDGLICGGRMTVLADPVHREEGQNYFCILKKIADQGKGFAEVIVIDPDQAEGLSVGSRVLYSLKGERMAVRGIKKLPQSVDQRVRQMLPNTTPFVQEGLAYLPVAPRYRLFIIGAGHIGQALSELAHKVDFDTYIFDDREQYANIKRFPVSKGITVGDMDKMLAKLQTDEKTFCVIVTRGHVHDEKALFHLINKHTGYLGMIGSRRKISLILKEFKDYGFSEEVLEKVHAPIGINIGSKTVPEIAISILAELIAHRNLGCW